MRALGVSINIGAKLLPSLNEAAGQVERRFGLMNRKLRVQAAETKVAFKEMSAALKPLAAMAAAGGLTMGIKGALGEGAEYQHEIAAMRMAGRSAKEVAQMIAAAHKTMADVPTSTLNRNLKMLQETTLAFGGVQHAMDNLSFNMKIDSLLKNQFGEDAGGSELFNKLVRSIELRGGKVPNGVYQKIASGMYKAMSVSGGTVTPDEFLGFTQQASPFMRSYSDDFYTRFAPSLIQEMGGERAGTALNAFGMQVMGRVPLGGKKLVAAWKEYGLLKPGAGGGDNKSRAGWNFKDVIGGDLALSNPYEYFGNVMIPKLQKAGVKLNDPKQVLQAAVRLFGRSTGQRLASTFLDPTQRARIDADRALFSKAMGPDQAYGLAMRNDPKMAAAAAAASLKNMETMLGNSVWQNPAVSQAILSVAKGINALAMVFEKHPGLGKAVLGLMAFGAVVATFAVFNIAIKTLFSPLRSLFGLLFSPAGAAGARIPWVVRIGRAFMSLARFVGPLLLRGLAALAPIVVEGVTMAFALLSNPIGWGIILGAAVLALGYYFRGPLMNAWRNGWNALKNWALSVNWGGIGMAIADKLTFGLASKLKNALSNPVATPAAGNTGMNSKRGGLAGARALGGPVRRGGLYLVGENGPELFRAQSTGHIFSHAKTAAMLAGAASAMVPQALAAAPAHAPAGNVEIHIHGAHDPDAVAIAVRRELEKLARAQAYNLND